MQPFGLYTFNSVFVATATTGLAVLTAMLAGYAFTYLQFPFKRFIFLSVLAVLMMPGQVSIVSLYVTISELGWLDSYWALIIPFIADAYGIYLVSQAFKSVPKDYIEAAKMEGAGHLRILFQVVGHLTKPSLIAYAIMSFKWRWNDYFWVLMMTSSQKIRTLPVGLVMMKVEDGGNQWHLIMAATVLVILPIIILYLVVQKFGKVQIDSGIKG
jgi:multiple sugar transport system permease protein